MPNEIVDALERASGNVGGTDDGAKNEPKSVDLDVLTKAVGSLGSKVEQLADLQSDMLVKQHISSIKPEPLIDETIPDYDEDPEANVDAKVKKAVEVAKKEVLLGINQNNAIAKWDKQADEDFPELLDKSSDFYKEVFSEYKNNTLNKQDPMAVYNAAARIHAKTGRGKGNNSNEAIRNYNAANARLAGATPSIGNARNPSDSVTDEERYMIDRLGYSEEKYMKLKQAKKGGRR